MGLGLDLTVGSGVTVGVGVGLAVGLGVALGVGVGLGRAGCGVSTVGDGVGDGRAVDADLVGMTAVADGDDAGTIVGCGLGAGEAATFALRLGSRPWPWANATPTAPTATADTAETIVITTARARTRTICHIWSTIRVNQSVQCDRSIGWVQPTARILRSGGCRGGGRRRPLSSTANAGRSDTPRPSRPRSPPSRSRPRPHGARRPPSSTRGRGLRRPH